MADDETTPTGAALPSPPTRPPLAGARPEPHWFIRDVVIVLLIGLGLAGFQVWMDDRRSEHEERLENLRFIRQQSSAPGQAAMPFAGMDLRGLILTGLTLDGANFSRSRLDEAVLDETNVHSVVFDRASVQHTSFQRSHFLEVNFTNTDAGKAEFNDSIIFDTDMSGSWFPGADFANTYLSGVSFFSADLSHARNLDKAQLKIVCYDENTSWPKNFIPPATADPDKCYRAGEG